MITFPSIASLFASTTTDAAYLLTAFLPLLVLALAVVIGVRGFIYLRGKLTGSIKQVSRTGGRRGGMRRRR